MKDDLFSLRCLTGGYRYSEAQREARRQWKRSRAARQLARARALRLNGTACLVVKVEG